MNEYEVSLNEVSYKGIIRSIIIQVIIMLSVIIPSVLSRQHIPGGKSAADDVRRDLDGKLPELDRRSQLSNPPGVNV